MILTLSINLVIEVYTKNFLPTNIILLVFVLCVQNPVHAMGKRSIATSQWQCWEPTSSEYKAKSYVVDPATWEQKLLVQNALRAGVPNLWDVPNLQSTPWSFTVNAAEGAAQEDVEAALRNIQRDIPGTIVECNSDRVEPIPMDGSDVLDY